MPYEVRDLPTVTVSSGGTAFLDASGSVWKNIGDATMVAIRVSASTAPGVRVEGEMSDTGTNFLPLMIYQAGTSAGGPGIASVVTASSGYVLQVNPAGMRQLRLATSAASTGGLSGFATKWIHVV